eukprot:COSAG02_NODE_40_length_47766_cov_88.053119_12_plen_63_part_00
MFRNVSNVSGSIPAEYILLIVLVQAYWPINEGGELRQNGPCSRDLLKKKHWLTLISATPRSA